MQANIFRYLVTTLAQEQERRLFWLPVAVGGGIAAYFSYGAEPDVWTSPALISASLSLLFIAWRWRLHRQFIQPGLQQTLTVIALIVMCFAVGLGAAQWRSHSLAAPVIVKRTGVVEIVGKVEMLEKRATGYRVVIVEPVISRLAPPATPAKVRLTVRTPAGQRLVLMPGDVVKLRGVLMPPPEAALPGDFDFVRYAWFRQIGGVGYAVSIPEVLQTHNVGLPGRRIEALRQRLSDHIQTVLPGDAGAVAAALMTGKRGAIPQNVLQNMRDAGLAHLLAISGLHIGLLAGLLFFALRAVLALIEPLALNYPIKKWAAVGALTGAFGYLLLSGSTVPTQRAFLMTGLVLLAVLLDRQAFSMALVAWAAGAVLMFAPESLTGPSFQMSFAAVIGLIGVYEVLRHRLRAWRGEGGFPRRLMLYVVGVMITTIIASLATGPFAAYHFGRLASYGLVANMIAVPVMAIWIMPWALAAFALMPFGLDFIALAPMGWGIDVVLDVAATVAAWPGAVKLLPAFSAMALGVFALGALWLALWQTTWRLAGVVPMAVALVMAINYASPDILIDANGKYLAVATPEGGLMLSSPRDNHTTRAWLSSRGLDTGHKWPDRETSRDGRLKCDGLSCLHRSDGQVVALVRDAQALREDCASADIIVSTVPVPRKCRDPKLVVDRFDLWRRGAHAIWLLPDKGFRVQSVADVRGQRLWSPKRDAVKK